MTTLRLGVVVATSVAIVVVWRGNTQRLRPVWDLKRTMLSTFRDAMWDDDDDGIKVEAKLLPTRYARRMDARVAAACQRKTGKRKTMCKSLSIVTWNIFRAFERGAEDLVGSWLGARKFDYVALNELNGLGNATHLETWAQTHGYQRAFLAWTNSGFHVGFLARWDTTCVMEGTNLDGFAHGVLHVACGRRRHFLVTHLTPFEAARRKLEVQWIAQKIKDILFTDSQARIALCGDLNSPPAAEPYLTETPWAVEALDDDKRRTQLKRKFFQADGIHLDDSVATELLSSESVLRDPCLDSSPWTRTPTDLCARTVPTAVGFDASHAFALRLDFILLSEEWRCACDCAGTVENDLTDVLSDHFPLAVYLNEEGDEGTTSLTTREASRRRKRRSLIAPHVRGLEHRRGTGISRRAALLEAPAAHTAYGETYRRTDDDVDIDQSNATTGLEPMTAAEVALACNWTLALGEEERRTKERAEEVRKRHAREWHDAERVLLGARLRSPWTVVSGATGRGCRETCEQRGAICVETKSKDDHFVKDCDRLIATFGCPFGCHVARGKELPAFVSDVDSFHAGRCLLPTATVTNERKLRRQRARKRAQEAAKRAANAKGVDNAAVQTRRRRLLDKLAVLVPPPEPVVEGPKKNKKQKMNRVGRQELAAKRRERRAQRRLDRLNATENATGVDLGPLGLARGSGRDQDAWCPASHPSTSRLCPCVDVQVVLAEVGASCDDACAENRADGFVMCHDAVLLNFNSRACDLLASQGGQRYDQLSVVRSDGLNATFAALPAVLNLPDGDLCVVAEKPPNRVLTCDAKLPYDDRRHHRRVCPCSPGFDPLRQRRPLLGDPSS